MFLWRRGAGGNELTDEQKVPCTFQDKNLSMLREIVDLYDSGRYMYPTSASGPNEFLDPANKGNNHDVHGVWKYLGPHGHYDYFNESDSLFHSEFGVDGINNLSALKTILSEKNIGVFSSKTNHTWRHHGEIWETLERDQYIFGKIESVEEYLCASQYIQGEGLRYALESNRRRAFQNSGSIIWQANEPWVNASCTNIIGS